MPLTFAGARSLVTSPTHLLRGAESASVSCWLRFDAVRSVAANVNFLGRQHMDVFSLYRRGGGAPTAIRAEFVAAALNEANQNIRPPLAATLPLGVNCHIAATWRPGTQKLFINGHLVASASIAGALRAPAASGFWRIGPDFADLDVTLDDPAVWSGYTLTTAEVKALRDRTLSPLQIAPAYLAYHPPLDGEAGLPATLGDAGLLDAGGLSLAIASITTPAPQYAAGGPLVYTPPARLRSATVGTSGRTVVCVFESDRTAELVNLTAVGPPPTIRIDGGEPITLGPAIWGVSGGTLNALPYAINPLPASVPTVEPGQSVTLTAVEGWARSSVGEVGPEIDYPVENKSTVPLSPSQPEGDRPMGMGWNVPHPAYFLPGMVFANICKQAGDWTGVGATGVTLDARGYLTGLTGGVLRCLLTKADTLNGSAKPGYPAAPPGDYVLLWDEPAAHDISATAPAITPNDTFTGVTLLPGEVLGQAVNNRRVYRVTRGADRYQIALALDLRSPNARNLRVYPPGIDADNPPLFHPEFLRMVEGAPSLRLMDATHTNHSNVVGPNDLPDPEAFSYNQASKFSRVRVIAVGPYTDAEGYFPVNGRFKIVLTTSGNHGLSDGQSVKLFGRGGQPASVTLSDGRPITLSDNSWYLVRVLTPTTFAIVRYAWNGYEPAAAPPLAAERAVDWDAEIRVERGFAPEHCAELANATGADLWLNVPHGLSDEGCAVLFARLVGSLAPGRKVRVEYTNEHWNNHNLFQQWGYCYGRGALDPTLSGSAYDRANRWYARRTGEVHAIAEVAFAAAGRAGDLIRVYGTQALNFPVTDRVLNQAVLDSRTVDEIAPAAYFWNGPIEASLQSVIESLSIEQLMDLFEVFHTYTQRYVLIPSGHGARADLVDPSIQVVMYEGGLENGYPLVSGVDWDRKSRACARHPRASGVLMTVFRRLEEAGCTLFHYYTSLWGVQIIHGKLAANWGAHLRWDMPDGPGDGSDGGFDNRTDPENLDRIESVAGYAVKLWNSGVAYDGGDLTPPPVAEPGPVEGVIWPWQIMTGRLTGGVLIGS